MAYMLKGLPAPSYKHFEAGDYFVGGNPTFGTGIAASAATGFVATTPYITVFNNNPAVTNFPNAANQAGVNIVLDYLKLTCTAAGASGTGVFFGSILDTGNRYSSGGSTITPVNANYGSVHASQATIKAGAVTATAATTPSQLSHGQMRASLIVVGDQYLFDYAPDTALSCGGAVENGTNPSIYLTPHSPVVIPPQATYLFYIWMPSGAASSFELELCYYER